jgi:ribosomal protein S18 acetylase RimI-like enzyme
MMSDWKIVPCTEADKVQLVEVCKQQWMHGESQGLPPIVIANIERTYTFEQYVEDNWQRMIIAKAQADVIGFIYWDGDEIGGMGVLPTWWRRGVGRSLMQYAEHAMRDQGVQTVRLAVYESNANAIQFYQSLGYSITQSFVESDWGAPVTMLVMAKTLK